MKIYRSITRVPGGLMVVPLFIGMVLNTFFPTLMQIGGFTQALTGVGYPTVLGMYLFTVGTKMTVRTAPGMLARGLGIMAAKVGTATVFALVVAHVFSGSVFGLSTLAVMVAMSDTNGGMFLALMSVMGNKEDAGTYVIQSIETGPFLTMVIFVGAGLAVIPWLTMVSVIAPIVVGAILAFIFSWNNFIFSVVLGGKNTRTLPSAVYNMLTFEQLAWGPLAAAALLVTLPVLLVTALAQREIIAGLSAGGLKDG